MSWVLILDMSYLGWWFQVGEGKSWGDQMEKNRECRHPRFQIHAQEKESRRTDSTLSFSIRFTYQPFSRTTYVFSPFSPLLSINLSLPGFTCDWIGISGGWRRGGKRVRSRRENETEENGLTPLL